MTSYKALMDPGRYLQPHEFAKEERKGTIARMARERLPDRDGEKPASAPFMYIRSPDGVECPRPYKVPKLVMHGLSLAYGEDSDLWVGKEVVLFAATCMAFGSVEPCIRVRFSAAVEAGIMAHLKKRKINPRAYMIREQGRA